MLCGFTWVKRSLKNKPQGERKKPFEDVHIMVLSLAKKDAKKGTSPSSTQIKSVNKAINKAKEKENEK